MPGLVVQNLGGGDAAWTIVDDELWKQIVDLQNHGDIDHGDIDGGDRDFDASLYNEWVCALTCTSIGFGEEGWPDGCPPRSGKIVRQFFMQTFCIETESLTGIVGVLTL